MQKSAGLRLKKMNEISNVYEPVGRKMTLMDIESITGLKIKEVKESAHYITALLENGVRFSIPKW